MNIFQKTCPECAAAIPMDATACRCGYCFDSNAHGSADPDEYAEQQNQLYRDYLAARIAQAEAELAVAREQAKADPHNTQKAAAALLALQAFNALQAEMKQLAPSTRRKPAQSRAASPARAPIAPAPNAPSVATKKIAAAPTSAARLGPAGQKTAPHGTRDAATRPHALPVRAAVAKTNTPVAAKAIGAPSRAPTVKPGASFTRLQAQRADAAARSQKTAAAKRPQPAGAPTQNCPNCTATVAVDAKRCSCGYTFARAEEVPALSLDAGALAILTGVSSPNTRRR